jgi:hypothetical protein
VGDSGLEGLVDLLHGSAVPTDIGMVLEREALAGST